MYQTLQYREDAAVATIQLNRPQKKNSLNAQMRTEMETLLHQLARKARIRAVIITGGDEIFCAGADIGEMEGTSSAEAAYQHAREFQILFNQVESLPQPVIAAVSGWALGGGCELALAADFRIASETARFGLPSWAFASWFPPALRRRTGAGRSLPGRRTLRARCCRSGFIVLHP